MPNWNGVKAGPAGVDDTPMQARPPEAQRTLSGDDPEDGPVDAVDASGTPLLFDSADEVGLEPPVRAPGSSSLPLVAFVLGIAAVVLGVTVVWYFAAVVIGLAAVVVGSFAQRRTRVPADDRARARATIGTVLGVVAVVLGVCAAFLLPRAVDRVDRFFGTLQDGVNHNVNVVNKGLRSDVDNLDKAVTRDLHRLETSNKSDLNALEKRSTDSLSQLEGRLNGLDTRLTDSERKDLDRLEQSLRADLRGLDDALRSSDSTLAVQIAGLEARIARLEKILGT
jgi:hypothetical protein